ncbi:aminotransferase class V-fold PLP-dependent enzyme [Rhizobium beringeri]
MGGKVCLDCVAYAPHRLIDVRADRADVLVFSFYKLFGPHNAMMWARRELLHSLANLNHNFIGIDESPYHIQPGGINYELSYGCIGITDYFVEIGNALGGTGTPRERMQGAFRAFELHEDVLAERLLGWLRGRPGIRIIGDETIGPDGRIPIISFVVDGKDSETIVRHMDRFDIGIRFGDFYAPRLIEALGIAKQSGVVRVSVAHYNVVEEMERLIENLGEII